MMSMRMPMRAAMALLVLVGTAFASVPAAADQIQDLIKRYGFEYRNAEVPWGVPVKARLSEVTQGEKTYQIDRASPLNEAGIEGVIKAYLQTHASNEIALIAHLFGGPARKVVVDVRKASTMEFPPEPEEPQLRFFRVHLAPIVEKGERFTVHCDFKFIRVGAQFYALYYAGEDGRMRSEQPRCDMSSDGTRLPM